jgi:DNA-binding LacI/PurR family transcriptional regulator
MNSNPASAVPLYRRIADQIRGGVTSGEYPTGGWLPSEPALARALGVSRGTLRQALKVLAERGVVETVPGRGTLVRTGPPTVVGGDDGRGRLVGMVIPAVARLRIPELIAGAEAELRAAGYTLLLGSSGDDQAQETEQIERFLREGVGGLIVYPVDAPSDLALVRRLVAERFPLVLVDRYPVDLAVDAVVADNFGGAFLAVRHLLGSGRRRIGFVSTHNLGTSSIAERQAGYRWALQCHGRPLEPALECTGLYRLFNWPLPGNPEREHNLQLLRRYLAQADRPDAVFTVNDAVAFQVLEAAELAGLRVPEDLAAVGFDNLAYPDYGGVPLTTVEQPRQEIGALAARVLLERVAGRRTRPARTVLGTRLIVRRSAEVPASDAPDRVPTTAAAVAGR